MNVVFYEDLLHEIHMALADKGDYSNNIEVVIPALNARKDENDILKLEFKKQKFAKLHSYTYECDADHPIRIIHGYCGRNYTIYDDFHGYTGSKTDKDEIFTYFNQYDHLIHRDESMSNGQWNSFKFAVHYRPLKVLIFRSKEVSHAG